MSIDIDQAYYNSGTASVASGAVIVTGQGTVWQGAVRAGDMFGAHLGTGVRIKSVDSNTQLTLAYPWPLAAQANAPYEIQFTPYDAGYQPAVRKLLSRWTNGNVDAFAALAGSADMVPVFTAPGAMTLMPTDMLGGGAGGSWNATVMLLAGRDAYNDRAAGFRVMVIGDGTERSAIYEKTGEGASDWSAPIYFTGHQGDPGIAGVEYGVTLKGAEGLGASHIGEYPASRSTRSSGRITRFYGEVLGGTGSVMVQVTINGRAIASPWTVKASESLQVANLQVAVTFGDAISFNILSISGKPEMAWFQLD